TTPAARPILRFSLQPGVLDEKKERREACEGSRAPLSHARRPLATTASIPASAPTMPKAA
ncbi:MAG TPA: hypothetical protein VFA72_12805, partial [Burkholderiales bacterium]|nr:hypothetical protein [Burkholderiales bacterium]